MEPSAAADASADADAIAARVAADASTEADAIAARVAADASTAHQARINTLSMEDIDAAAAAMHEALRLGATIEDGEDLGGTIVDAARVITSRVPRVLNANRATRAAYIARATSVARAAYIAAAASAADDASAASAADGASAASAPRVADDASAASADDGGTLPWEDRCDSRPRGPLRLIFVDGPPGSGKSRFMNEVLDGLPKCLLPSAGIAHLDTLYASGDLTLKEYAKYRQEIIKSNLITHVEAATASNKTTLVVEGNPLYSPLITTEFSINRIETMGPVADPSVIYELLSFNALPYKVFVCSIPHPSMDRWSLIYSRPSKNFGKCVREVHFVGDEITVHPWEFNGLPLLYPTITSVEARIAGGKTSYLDSIPPPIARESLEHIEPLLRLAPALHPCNRLRVLESAIMRGCRDSLYGTLEASSGTNIHAERLILYIEWYFGSRDTPYPTIDQSIVDAVRERGFTFGDVCVVNTSFEDARRRMVARGRDSDMKWDTAALAAISEKFDYLFNSPYEWPYARVRYI